MPWGGYWGIDSYVIKCARDPSHDTVVPVKGFYQMWREGKELPSFIKDNIERKLREEIMEQNNVKALVIKKDADKLSTYLQAKFPKDLVSRDVAMDFARWCISHQLEPIRDCVPYQGNPYICVEWLDRQASNDDKFKGYSYNVFSQKDKESLDFDPKDLVVECQADWEGLGKPLVGLGVVTIKEREAKTGREIDEDKAKGYRSPVVRLKPQQMVFKRARASVLKQRYHIPAPILEELPYTTIIDAKYRIITEPSSDESKASEAEGKLDDETRKLMEQALEKEESQDAKTEDVAGEGFTIDLQWLKDSKKGLKWADETMLTFIISQYKVSGKSDIEALGKLTRDQAEDFVKQINKRMERQQPKLI